MRMHSLLFFLFVLSTKTLRAGDAAPLHPADVPDLICFWDFQEPAGEARIAKGPFPYALAEMRGPVERVDNGVFGKYSAKIARGQWFNLPRADCPALDIHGKEARVTVVAWIKRAGKEPWQSIGGVWDESRSKRQYYLFVNASTRTDKTNLKRIPGKDFVHGHVSSVGGPTPGHEYCITYSSGNTPIPLDEWRCIAMSYDGKHSRVYVDGILDASERYNPFPYDEGLYDGGKDGADFTVGSNSVGGKPSNFFSGLIGGLAVYKRALSDDELIRLAATKK